MGLLEFFKEKANNPSIAGFNEPLLQYQQKKSKKLADSTRHYNQLADTLAPIYKEALAQNPNTDKEALAQSLVRAYSDNIESNFTKEEAQAYNQYRQHRDIDPATFKRLWDNAPKEQDTFLPAESFDYNTQKWINLLQSPARLFGENANNLQELQQIEINRLKQKRGQDIFSLETASDLIDPIGVLLPAGTVAKVGAKGYNLLKSALGGSAIGALVGAQELNRNDTALKDNLTNIVLGAGVGGLLNAGLGAVINKATTGRWTGGILDTINPNTPKANPQTAMQGIEIGEQAAENLTPNQNKTADELLQKQQQLQESQTTPQTNPTLAQGVEQILNDNTYPTPKQESAGIEISEQAAENLSKSKDIEARSNALIHNTYANLKAQLDNRQGILQAIREQMPQPNNEAQALQAIREQALREQAIREKGTLLESISEQAREQNLPKVFNKIENHPLLARIKEQMPTTQQATHLPQTPQQIEQLANDLTQLSREYPQVFKGYTPQLKEVLQNNTDTLFKNGALNKDNFRALLERIDAEITPKATESLSVVKKNLTTENKQLKSDLTDNLSIENITLPPTPSAKGYDLDRTLSGEYDKVIIPQNAVALKNPNDIHYKQESTTKSLLERIKENRVFGKNYPQFYHKGSEAIGHLLQKRSGQVKGAFHKEGIGDIDLVWGDDKIGLQKIITKHSNDFTSFGEGQKGIINGLSETIKQGKVFEKNNVKTIWHKKDDAYYAVGLSKGWYGKGDNEWVITGYKKTKGEIPKEIKGDTANLSAYSDKFNPLLTSKDEPLNSTDIIPQSPNTLQDNANASTTKQGALGSFTSRQNNSITKNTDELEKTTNNNFSVVLTSRDKDGIGGFFKQQKEYILENERIAKEYDAHAKRYEKEGDKGGASVMLGVKREQKKKAQKLRDELMEFYELRNYKPLSEFGTNYIEFIGDGKGAIQKLLEERQGQVAGAFYRKELGDIDLVWGDSSFGLKHILEKHGSEFKDIAKELDEIIQNGKVAKTHNGYNITLGDYKVGLNIGWNENGVKIGENKWVVTAFDNSKSQSEKQGSNSASLTKGETLPSNSTDIIPQTTQKAIKAKENGDIHFKLQDAPKESELLQRLDKVAPKIADATRLNHLEHSLKEAQTRFKLRNKDKENAKLFDKVIVVAQQLGVKFDNKGTSIKGELGHFNPSTNTAKIFTQGEKEAETILHELIHSVTNRALHTNPKDLTPLQVEAINDIKNIFETLSKDKSFKQMYALSSVDEMLSELSNKEFRTMLRGKNILQRLYNAIAKIIFKRKDNYDNLESALYKLIDNYSLEGKGYESSTHYKLSPQQKEQRGLYNVTYNGKNATLIKRDLEAVDEALKLTQGYHLEHSQKGKGAKHIRINHLQDPTKQGYITDLELVNLGKDLRTFLKDYAPFVEKQKSGQEARIYEWENKEGVRFRLVSKIQGGGTTADSHLESAEEIITFYSDRNLKERMKFKNPALNDIFYKIAEDIKSPSVFKRTLDAVLDKTLRADLFQDTINRLGFKTSSNEEYMQLREDILNGTNGSVKGVVDFNNLLNAKLSKEQLRELQRYYVGDDYDSKIVTQELKDIADTVMNKINALTQVGIKKGIFPEYYGEMKGYLKRSYEKHTFNDKVPLKSSTLEFHKLFHRGTSKYVSPSTLQRMRENGEMAVTLKDYKEGKWVISENKDSKGNVEIYRDWSKKEREKMGEIEDFSFNAARTIDTLQKQLYTHDFLKELEAKKIIIKAEGNKAPVGYVDTKGEFGIIGNPFKNYYVKAEVASDLKDTFYKLYGDFSKAQKLLKEAVGLWKAGKTIWNPVSHMNNILGNFFFMLASGEYKAGAYLLKNIAMGRKIFKDYRAYKEAKINNKYLKSGSVTENKDMQLLEELERRGYFDKSFLNVIADNYHLKHNGIKAGKENLLKRFHNKLGNVYNAEDVLARFSLAKSFMEEGMEMDKALKLTSEILPDYSKPMPYWLKNADRLGFLPFVQFIYHATPIMWRQINPRAKSVKGDSWNKQALVNLLAIGAYAAYQQLITPMPDGYFGSEFVYYQNGDTARTIRIGSIVPHIQMLEFLPGSGSGDWNLLPEFLRKALVGSVYTQGFGVLGNKNYTFDTKITRRNGTLGAVDMLGGAIDFALPAPVGKVYTMANNALTKDSKNRRSKIHNERNLAESTLGLLGLNLKSYNKRELAEKRQRDLLKGK